MLKKRAPTLLWGMLMVVYAYLSYLMVEITLQYVPFDDDVAFLRIKQDYIGMTHYKLAFMAHVFSSVFVLVAGFTQFSTVIRKRFFLIHKTAGLLYAGITLLFAAPSGFVIGLYANGGFSSQLAFCLLAICWFIFTLLAVIRAKQHDIPAHRRWMIRSFALALSAITLRAWKFVIVGIFHPRPMDVYIIIAWLGWVLNLIIAEILIYNSSKK